jgi:ubiquinone biosynthesis protein UbiJ
LEILSPAVDALNHILRQNAWAPEQLRPYAGKTLRLELAPLSTDVTIVDSGLFVPAVENPVVDAGITLSPTAALRFALSREFDLSGARMEGDHDLATGVGRVLQQLEWEVEEDLSRLLGNIPAHQLVSTGKRVVGEGKRQLRALGEMLADYWQEEQPLIAKQRYLEAFSREVDTLRDDLARLTKRIEKLEKPH